MRIVVNGRFRGRAATGVDRYAWEISSRLSGLEFVEPHAGVQGIRGHLWEQASLPWRFRGDLLWSPCTTGPLAVRRQIVTIHDCAFIEQADCFSRSMAAWYQWLLPRLARRVLRVLTVSEYSRNRLVELLRLDPAKVVAIPNGVSERFQPAAAETIAETKRRLNLPERYLLSVGSLEPRKNLRRLLAAWRQIASDWPDVSLVVAGAKFSQRYRDAGLDDDAPRVFFTGYLADDDLPTVYSGAELFVYPSLYEGFGLPVLEAMACGAPVVCSQTTSLPEVAGAAALLVNPLDIAAITSGVAALLADPARRNTLRTLGKARAAQFTWERAAARTQQVFQDALSSN